MGAYDIALKKKYGNDGITQDDTNFLYSSLNDAQGYPVEFMANESECSAMGFMSPRAAKSLEYEYEEISKFLADKLDEKIEDATTICRFQGLFIMIN